MGRGLVVTGFFHGLHKLVALRILGGTAAFALAFNEIVDLSVLLSIVLFFEQIASLRLIEIGFGSWFAMRPVQTVLIHAWGVVVKVTLEIVYIEMRSRRQDFVISDATDRLTISWNDIRTELILREKGKLGQFGHFPVLHVIIAFVSVAYRHISQKRVS